jgi:hypothetical protein
MMADAIAIAPRTAYADELRNRARDMGPSHQR